jgi:hypothetical protein
VVGISRRACNNHTDRGGKSDAVNCFRGDPDAVTVLQALRRSTECCILALPAAASVARELSFVYLHVVAPCEWHQRKSGDCGRHCLRGKLPKVGQTIGLRRNNHPDCWQLVSELSSRCHDRSGLQIPTFTEVFPPELQAPPLGDPTPLKS